MHGLLGAPVARSTDPDTSHQAAARIKVKSFGWARQALDALERHGALTDDELCRICEVPDRYWPSMKSARSRLKRAGLVVSAGGVWEGQTVWTLAETPCVPDREPEDVPDDTETVDVQGSVL